MPVEKDKVLAAIELKFKGKSITKTFKDNLATKWAAKIDNDTDIDGYIEDREDVILEAVSEADRRATDAVKKVKAETEPPKKEEIKKEDEEIDLPADTPEYVKMLMKQNKEISERLNGFETAQQQKSITERFKTDERLKGIPEFVFKGRIPAKEEDFETAVTELATEYSDFAKEAKITTFGQDKPTGAPGQPTGTPKEATKEEIDAVVADMKM